MKNLSLSAFVILFFTIISFGQTPERGQLTGDVEINSNFYIRDSTIGAANIPQYDRQKQSVDSWFTLNYTQGSFDASIRFDAFGNSNLFNPNGSYSAIGLGRWHVRKKIALKEKVASLELTGGYIYDQVGNGQLFRAFETRPLLIDNALVGARAVFDYGAKNGRFNLRGKVLAGKQKKMDGQPNLFEVYDPLISVANVETFWKPKDSVDFTLSTGVGALHRTLDDQTMTDIVANIESDSLRYRFIPKYNTYGFTFYNTLVFKNFSWYFEGTYKTNEAIPDFKRTGRFKDALGTAFYTSLSYSKKGFGVTLQARRLEDYWMRVSPFILPSRLTRGQVSFLASMQRQNAFRLPARYGPPAQELGEWAWMGDISYTLNKKINFALTYSSISSLNSDAASILANPNLFRELYFETTYKINKKNRLVVGLQWINYNQKVYEQKDDALAENAVVKAWTPFVEYQTKFNSKHSLRVEAQYMFTTQDLGPWAFLLGEYNISPHWSFTAAGLLNVEPRKLGVTQTKPDGSNYMPIFYPTLAVFYSYKTHRISVSYVKQPQGVVCTGGICRLEPAFSGVKVNLASRF